MLWTAVALAAAPPRQRLEVRADDGHALTLWAEEPDHPKGALLLLHGRTWSSVPDFDLEVAGRPSTMDALAEEGLAVYALDLRGYGGTPRDPTGWDTPDRAARDLASAAAFVGDRRPELGKPAVLGWSLGALVAHLAVQRRPELVSALILYGYPRDVQRPVTSDDIPPDAPPPRKPNTEKNAASDFVTPGSIDDATVAAYVAAALAADPVRADWRAWEEFGELDAARLTVPTLVLHGALDPSTSFTAQEHLFAALGTPDRAWVELAGADHDAHLEHAGPAFVHAVVGFLCAPRSATSWPVPREGGMRDVGGGG